MEENERSLQTVRSPAATSVRDAALAAFARDGFDGASVRQIARAAGVSISVLYHHYGNKQDLLYEILSDTTRDLLDTVQLALDGAKPKPTERFSTVVRTFADFYASRSLECRALNTEMRCLTPGNYRKHLVERRKIQHLFDHIIEEGCEAGEFGVANPHLAGRVIVVMCRDIATWFDPEGPQSREEISEQYVHMALQMVEAKPAARRRARIESAMQSPTTRQDARRASPKETVTT
jgi:AcrR family transcriptional regulator